MGCSEKRDIEIPACKESNPGDCHRTYHLYLPSVVCDDGDRGSNRRGLQGAGDAPAPGGDDDPPTAPVVVGTLPLVFAVHCFGCRPDSIDVFIAHANDASVVLAVPVGIQSSFNARHCCGYALQNDVDDLGFFKHIQSSLSEEYPFVQSDYSYGVGWSNGGFMVMHAASLFKSISPISGFMYDIDPSVKNAGTFCVDGICVDAPGAGKGIFIHHGVDDSFVQSTGCCSDPDMPTCCCSIAAETCVSTMEVARNWAMEVNGCEVEKEEGSGTSRTLEGEEKGEDEEGGGDEAEKEEKETNGAESEPDGEGPDGAGEESDEGGDEEKEQEATTISSAKFVTSYTDSDRGIDCLTTTGKDCKANTTICLHAHSGHFNNPSFGNAFPFAREVIRFFAKDACETHDGKWDEAKGFCTCPENWVGVFCLDELDDEVDDDFYTIDPGTASSMGSLNGVIGYSFFALAVWYFTRHRCKRAKKKVDTYINDEEATELVSPQRFR